MTTNDTTSTSAASATYHAVLFDPRSEDIPAGYIPAGITSPLSGFDVALRRAPEGDSGQPREAVRVWALGSEPQAEAARALDAALDVADAVFVGTFVSFGDTYLLYAGVEGTRASTPDDEKLTDRHFHGDFFSGLAGAYDSRDDEISLTGQAAREAHQLGLRLAIDIETGSAFVRDEDGVRRVEG